MTLSISTPPPSEPAWELDPAPIRPAPPAATPPAAAPPSRATPASPAVDRTTDTQVRALLTAILEAIDGRRSPETLSVYLRPGPQRTVQQLARHRHRDGNATGSVLRTVQVHPSPTTLEVCATYGRGKRVFALAARISTVNRRPLMTALRMFA